MRTTNQPTLPIALPLAAMILCLLTPPAYATYKCKDEKGVTHYGDTMPPQCATKAITEMSKQGTVVKQYDAPLTPEQLKAQREDAERRKEENKKIAEQKLKDTALLSTYGSEKEFDVAREKETAVLDARKKSLMARNVDIDKNLKKQTNEMEFYQSGKSKGGKGKDAPPQLVQDLARAKSDRAALDSDLAKVDADKKEVTARFEVERTRWKKLKSGMAAGTLLDDKGEIIAAPGMPSQIVGQSTIIPGRPRGTATCDGKTYECSLGLLYLCRAPNIGGPGVNTKAVKCVENR